MQQTSLDAYTQLKPTTISLRHHQIISLFKQLKGEPLSNLDVSCMLNLPINAVTPRTNELVKQKRLVHCGYKYQLQTGMKVRLLCLQEDYVKFIDERRLE